MRIRLGIQGYTPKVVSYGGEGASQISDSAKRIARLGVLTALSVILLLLTSVLPAGRLGLMVIASFPVCAALMMYGWGWALGVFAVTAALSGILFPNAAVVLYAVFFGYYPIAKSLLERLRGAWLSRILKFVLYAVVFFAAYRLLSGLLLTEGTELLPWYVLFLLGAAAFAVYDWCCSVVIRFYLEKIARYFP